MSIVSVCKAVAPVAVAAALVGGAPLANAQPGPDQPSKPAQSGAATPEGRVGAKEIVVKVPDGGYFEGYTYFAAPGANHGGFVFVGTSHDDSNNDEEVYLEVAVAGYGPNEFRNPVDQAKDWNHVVWDPAAQQVGYAKMRICNANPAWDRCSEWREFWR